MSGTIEATEVERAADGGLTLDQCLAAAETTRLVSATDSYLLRACRLLADELAAVRAEVAALTAVTQARER